MVRAITWALGALSIVPFGVSHASSDANGCTAPPIPNGGFETGSLSPWVQVLTSGAKSSATVVSGGDNSNYAVQLSVGYGAAIRQKQISTCVATNYTIEFNYKVISSTAGCSIYATAGADQYDQQGASVPQLQPGNWQTASLEFDSDLDQSYTLEVGLGCEEAGQNAVVLVDNIQAIDSGSLDPPGCPGTVSIVNGGFDNGDLSSWTQGPDNNDPIHSTQPKFISPGYDNSAYALELDFPAANYSDFLIAQYFQDLCVGYNYEVSLAINWLDYTGVQSNEYVGCKVGVLLQSCDASYPEGQFYATSTPGWQQVTYQCQADQNVQGELIVEVLCDDDNAEQPAFTVQLDDFSVQALGFGGQPPPSSTPVPSATDAARDNRAAVPRWF